MPTRNVHLSEHMEAFIEAGINSGRYRNASEVVREGLRLLEAREEEDRVKIEWLRSAAKEGFEAGARGDFVGLNSPEEVDAILGQIHEEIAAELTAERGRG